MSNQKVRVFLNGPVSKQDQSLDRRIVLMVENAIARTKIQGAPVARYDVEKRKPYLEYSNGKRVYSSGAGDASE